MEKVAIVIDNWKLPIFTRRLQHSGYSFDQIGGLTPDSMVLRVDTENVVSLGEVVKAANTECAKTGAPK